MTRLDEIRAKYTPDQIGAVFYSMLDSVWDLAFNYDMCYQSPYTEQASKEIIEGKESADLYAGIEEQMRRDTDLIFANSDFRDSQKFIRACIQEWYSVCRIYIIGYIGGPIIQGRLHPETIATNGVAKAYLFLHDDHPKHRLNKFAKKFCDLAIKYLLPNNKGEKGYLNNED